MKSAHIISTTDPINGFNITDLKNRPHSDQHALRRHGHVCK